MIPISHAELRNYLEKAIIEDQPEVDHTKTIKPKTTMTILPVNGEKKSRFSRRAKAQEAQAESQTEDTAELLQKLNLEYSVSDEALLEEDPKDTEVK